MSQVTLIVIDGKKIHYVQTHWRTIQDLLDLGFDGMLWKKAERKWDEYLDAGYILLDLNRNLLVNGQNAFAVNDGYETAEV